MSPRSIHHTQTSANQAAEAARARNFALYGYGRPTDPLLSSVGVIALKRTSSCATYTTAAVRCILSNTASDSPFSKRFEPLPSYLQRNGVDVIWLKHLTNTSAALLYMSDHGESLGEYGFYLHGMPYSIAPDVQKEVPFIVWMSEEFVRQKAISTRRLESQVSHSQRDIFHSVMGAFSMRSDAYLPEYDLFDARFAEQ